VTFPTPRCGWRFVPGKDVDAGIEVPQNDRRKHGREKRIEKPAIHPKIGKKKPSFFIHLPNESNLPTPSPPVGTDRRGAVPRDLDPRRVAADDFGSFARGLNRLLPPSRRVQPGPDVRGFGWPVCWVRVVANSWKALCRFWCVPRRA